MSTLVSAIVCSPIAAPRWKDLMWVSTVTASMLSRYAITFWRYQRH